MENKQFDNNTNYVSKVLESITALRINCPIELVSSKKKGVEHAPVFEELYSCPMGQFMGIGGNKREAKNNAYYKIYNQLTFFALKPQLNEKQELNLPKFSTVEVPPSVPGRSMESVIKASPGLRITYGSDLLKSDGATSAEKRSYEKMDIDSPTVTKAKNNESPLGVAIFFNLKSTSVDFLDKNNYIKRPYDNESLELLLFSKGADCYRKYTDGDEFQRLPDLPGIEETHYVNFRNAKVLENQKEKIKKSNDFLNKTPFKELMSMTIPTRPPPPSILHEKIVLDFINKIRIEVNSLIEGDDTDKDFLKKYLFSPDSQTNVTNYLRERTAKDMEGSFNPYGNGQFSMQQYTIMKPGFSFSDTTWTCFSTCLLPDPTHVSGTGATQTESFDDWRTMLDSYISNWAPPQENCLINELTTKYPKPDPASPIYNLWDEDKAILTLRTLVKQQFRISNQKESEGSFNPYGNGQFALLFILFVCFYFFFEKVVLTKQQYLAQNNIKSLSKAEQKEKWKNYIQKHNISRPAKKEKTRPQQPQVSTRAVAKPPKNQIIGNAPSKIVGMRGPKHGTLGDCALAYLIALKCPFYYMDWERSECMDTKLPKDKTLPCIPGPDGFNTRKWVSWARGVAGVQNTTNHFSLMFAPFRMANNYNPDSNRAPPILYTVQAPAVPQTANQFPVVDTGAVGWLNVGGAASFNTEYTIANNLINAAGQGMKHRVVGAGVRVKYTGPLLNEAGMFHFITEPDHVSLSNYTLDEIGKFEGYFNRTVHKDNSGKWHTMTFTPVQPEDSTFHPDPLSNGQFTVFDNHFMAVMGTGLPAGTHIAFECIVLVETIGNLVRGKTISPVDTVGQSIVKNGISSDQQANNDAGATISSAIKTGENLVSGVVNIAEQVAPFVKMMSALVV